MTAAPTWTILIPTVSARAQLFRRLLSFLLPQVTEAGDDRVRVVAWRNDGDPRLAEIRDAMVATAETDYVSFIDDDDLVSTDFVRQILPALDERPDHVGFQVEYTTDGAGREIVDHSLRHGRWHRTHAGQLVRDFTHIDPVRTELARRGRFATAKPNRPEDRVWVKQVRPFLATEAYIDKILYYYLHVPASSAWPRESGRAPTGYPRPVIEHPHFFWHHLSDP